MAFQGYGEVELHWHHPPADNETFPGMLREAIAWFQQHGALVSSDPEGRTHFAFIHGNWALDNSLPICGVSRELDILFQHGCYADFTFSTIGTYAQPRKINAIYYATDTNEPKSYNDGEDVQVGSPVDDRLMIFQGPLHFHWLTGRFEYGALESFALPSHRRINEWIDTNIHVRGRPEWVFVKVYSHGMLAAVRDWTISPARRAGGRRWSAAAGRHDIGGGERRRLLWRGEYAEDKAAGIECPGEEEDSSPRRDLREWRLPWVYLSMIDDLFRGKALVEGRGGAVAC